MPLPHYGGNSMPGLDYLKELKIITCSYLLSINDYLIQVEKYNISMEDLYSVNKVKIKIREYNLSKILESI